MLLAFAGDERAQVHLVPAPFQGALGQHHEALVQTGLGGVVPVVGRAAQVAVLPQPFKQTLAAGIDAGAAQQPGHGVNVDAALPAVEHLPCKPGLGPQAAEFGALAGRPVSGCFKALLGCVQLLFFILKHGLQAFAAFAFQGQGLDEGTQGFGVLLHCRQGLGLDVGAVLAHSGQDHAGHIMAETAGLGQPAGQNQGAQAALVYVPGLLDAADAVGQGAFGPLAGLGMALHRAGDAALVAEDTAQVPAGEPDGACALLGACRIDKGADVGKLGGVEYGACFEGIMLHW